MAAHPPTILRHLSLYSVDRGGQAIVGIVLHGTAGTDSLAYLTKNPRSVSCHYLIPQSGDTIYRMVNEARGANHAGAITSSFNLNGTTYKAGAVNRATIGIELESMQTGRDDYTDLQLLAMGWLINDIRTRYPKLPLLRHAELDSTRRRDPVGLSHDQLEKWSNAAMLVYTPLPTPPRPAVPYRLVAPCVPLTARSPSAPLAAGVVFQAGDMVNVGDVTAGWLWVSDRPNTEPGIGFIPQSYARPV